MKIARFLIITLILLVPTVSAFSQDQTGPVPGRFIVKLKPGLKADAINKSLSTPASVKPLINPTGLTTTSNPLENYYIFSSPDESLDISAVIAAIGEDKIESIEPDYYLEFFDYPGDTYFSDQWYMHNEGQEYLGIDRYDGESNDQLVLKTGTPGVDIKLDNYYATLPPEAKAVIVAIIDSGVDIDHPELVNQLWVNEDEIPDNGLDDDHNGYVDDVTGFDLSGDIFSYLYPEPDNDPRDDNGHGTHIAGIVAAEWNNYGIAGVAPNAKIMPLKIQPNSLTSISAQAIIYAVDNGAKVINVSWGTAFDSNVLREAFNYAYNNDVLICTAAGNSGDTNIIYPAVFETAFVVAASNSDGYLTGFSSYGPYVDIVAPGEDILSLRAAGTDLYDDIEPGLRIIGPDSNLILSDGTSMSAPVVVGAAALLWSYHPEMRVDQMEQLLLLGADDMVDPFNQGDSLPGPDSLSGYGTLNIDHSFALMTNGGIFLTNPVNRTRYSGAIDIKAAAIGGYNEYWKLEFSEDNQNWELLGEDITLPSDSVLFSFNRPEINGVIHFKLTDINGQEYKSTITYVNNDLFEISSPVANDSIKYNVDIIGSAYGLNYDSIVVKYLNGLISVRLAGFTDEYFGELIYNWPISGLNPGNYKIVVEGYFSTGLASDTIEIMIESAFAAGWPVRIGSYGSVTPIITDLNKDGSKEIALGCSQGFYLFHADGSLVDGFPILTDKDVRTIPMVYDIDRDGEDEIVLTDIDGLHVINYDGSEADGWPIEAITSKAQFGYGYPYPSVGKLGMAEDSAIFYVCGLPSISAYEFNGDSYFYSLDGFFGQFINRSVGTFANNKQTGTQATSVDINQDGLYEIIASYSSPVVNSGIGIFDGRSGLPAFGFDDPVRVLYGAVLGFALNDINHDSYLNIISLGVDTNNIVTLNVTDYLGQPLDGWPILFPELSGWLGNFPVIADLNLDGTMEILFTFFEYEIAYLYIFNADGTPYKQVSGYPEGVAFTTTATIGVPGVANLVGDDYPEIIFRTGHLIPGFGNEDIYLLDHTIQPVPGWPIATPATPFDVVSSRFAPLVDDIDNDSLVELIFVSDNTDLLVWDFEASYDGGRNQNRLFGDNLNSNIFDNIQPVKVPDDVTIATPREIELLQNYPNPFSTSTVIEFTLYQKETVRLSVYDLYGDYISTILDEELDRGSHRVEFHGADLSDGIYFYRLETGDDSRTGRMVLIK